MKKICLILVLVIACLAENQNDIHSFTINVKDADLADLQIRLEKAILPSPRDEAGWNYGMNLT